MLQIKKIPEDCVMSLIISSNCKFTNLAACVMCPLLWRANSVVRLRVRTGDNQEWVLEPAAKFLNWFATRCLLFKSSLSSRMCASVDTEGAHADLN